MTVKELIAKLETMDGNKQIVLGVQGYQTYYDGEYSPIGAYENDNAVLLADGCYYEEIDG